MERKFRERIAQLAKVRYGTSDLWEAGQKLSEGTGIPNTELSEILNTGKAADWQWETMAIELCVDREDLFADANVLRSKQGFREYLDRLKKGDLFPKLWPILRDGIAYRTESGDLEKPLDERHFRTFMADQELSVGGDK